MKVAFAYLIGAMSGVLCAMLTSPARLPSGKWECYEAGTRNYRHIEVP